MIPGTPARRDDELPALPPLEGDDAPLGEDAGGFELFEGDAGLDDAAADLALDLAFEETAGGEDSPEGPLDVGADDEGIVVEGSDNATDDAAFDDRSPTNDLEAPPLPPDDDQGDEGPLRDAMDLGAPPPLDDDDDEPPARPRAGVRALALDGVLAAARAGSRWFAAAAEVCEITRALSDAGPVVGLGTPEGIVCALAGDGRGAIVVATLDGGVWTHVEGAWRPQSEQAVRALLGGDGVVWARARDGSLLVWRERGPFIAVPEVQRAGAWALGADGSLVVYDVIARGARWCDARGRWAPLGLPEGLVPARFAIAADAVACADVRGSLWRSVDRGASWERLREGPFIDLALVGDALLVVREAKPESLQLLRVDPSGALHLVATLKRGAERDEVCFVGCEAPARVLLLVDGRLYVVDGAVPAAPRS